MEDTNNFALNNTKNGYKSERIIVSSISASNKIDRWEDSRFKSWIVAVIPVAIALIIIFFATNAEDRSVRRSFSTPGMQILVFICLAFAAFLFYCSQKAQKANSQIVLDARKKASKENIVVTDQRIYGSTEKKPFSINLSEIKETYIQRIDNQNAKISDEVLRIITLHETLTFEFLENNAEICNSINSVIPPSPKEPVPLNLSENAETYTIKLISYSSLIPATKAIRSITNMDFAAAKDYLDNLPAIFAENIPLEKAEEICSLLEINKVNFDIYQS